MINSKYAKAYKEVLEIIKYFPEDELNKIPQEKIDYYKENMDKEYKFEINPKIDLSEQNISKEASAIIVTLFRDYFATKEQKKKLEEIIKLNKIKLEKEKKNKYNPDDLFKSNNNENINQNNKETVLVAYKESFFTKFKKFVFRILHINI